MGSLKQPQPGVKVDYDSYLRAAPRSRAWMHASGAIITKLLPFVMLVLALSSDFPSWTAWLFLAQGVLQIVTDCAVVGEGLGLEEVPPGDVLHLTLVGLDGLSRHMA